MNTALKLSAIPSSPESDLRYLFEREDKLLAELSRVRNGQREARNAYAKAHGLLMRPGLDQLRKVLL